jgi:hypothetical protein
MNNWPENKCLSRAKSLAEERRFYKTAVGAMLLQDGLIRYKENYPSDFRSLPTIDEMILFLLFCRQYYISKRIEQK